MAWKIDTSHTTIEFGVKHMMVTTVRGRFTQFDGTITVDPSNLLNSKVEGWIDTGSVDTHDANRDAHLRSPDFFDAETYPRMTFVSKRIEKVSGRPVQGDRRHDDQGRDPRVHLRRDERGQEQEPVGRRDLGPDRQGRAQPQGLRSELERGALETGGWLVGDQVKIHVEMELVKVEEPVAEAVAA